MVSLEESKIFSREEISYIIELDQKGNPFISEVLLLEGSTLSIDKLRLLYPKRNKPILKEKDM